MKYVVFVQRYIDPVCTEEAEMIFQAYFSYLRGRTTLTKDRKTIRMLESLIRLSEAHARMMFRKDIIIYDAISVVILMEHCINTGLFDENYPIVMSRQMYEKAKEEALTKLGLDPSYFSEEFDAYGEKIKEQVNAMGEETRMNLDTSYYNGEKTEYTVEHRTYTTNNQNHQDIKNENYIDASHEMGTHVNDNMAGQSQHSHYMSNQGNINQNTVVVDDEDGPNTFIDRKVILKKMDDVKDEKKNINTDDIPTNASSSGRRYANETPDCQSLASSAVKSNFIPDTPHQ